MFLLDRNNVIIGRGLTPAALAQLVDVYESSMTTMEAALDQLFSAIQSTSDTTLVYETIDKFFEDSKDNPEFFDASASFSWKVGTGDWDNGRFITCTAGSKSFVVVGNFTTEQKTFTAEMPSACTWTNHFDRNETFDGGSLQITLPAGEFKLLTNF